jgi:hypothetical protein
MHDHQACRMKRVLMRWMAKEFPSILQKREEILSIETRAFFSAP